MSVVFKTVTKPAVAPVQSIAKPDARLAAHPSRRPEFIPREVFRIYMTTGRIDGYLRVDGMRAGSYIKREKLAGRPFPSVTLGPRKGFPDVISRGYRMLDIVARARAQALSVKSSWDDEIVEPARELVKVDLEVQAHRLALVNTSIRLTGAKLLSEKQVVAASIAFKPECGVYFLISNSQVMYVGQSINVGSRIRQHAQNFVFDAYSYIPCTKDQLDLLESVYIHHFHPQWNGVTISGLKTAPISLIKLFEQLLPSPGGSA